MENDYSFKLEKLKTHFTNLILFSKKLDAEKNLIRSKLQHFKETHHNLSKANNKQIFLFCLDSFLFQYKMFNMEISNLDKMHTMIKNRLYCDYYKLYKMIVKYINYNFDDFQLDLQELPVVPVYKDLEPMYDYGYNNVELVHNSLLDCIKKICSVYLNKQEQISDCQTNTKVGYGISNFISTMNHESDMLQGKIDLYINYVSFFNVSQIKYMKRLYLVYDEFDKQLQSIINNDDSLSFEEIINNSDESSLLIEQLNDTIPLSNELSETDNDDVDDANSSNLDTNTNVSDNPDQNSFVELKEEDVPVFTSLNNLEQKQEK